MRPRIAFLLACAAIGLESILAAENETEPVESNISTTPAVTEEESTTGTSTVVPSPDPALYVIKHDGKACLLANLNTTIRISYEASGEFNQSVAKTVPVEIGGDGDAFESKCAATNKDIASLIVNWGMGTFKLQLDFSVQEVTGAEEGAEEGAETGAEKMWSLSGLKFTYDRGDNLYFPDAVVPEELTVEKDNLTMFQTPLGKSYLCATGDEILVGEIEKGAAITFTEIRLQPFAVKEGAFGEANVCTVDAELEKMEAENWLVPVAVAGCLAFIIIVLITVYIISRNIKRTGYRNMD